MLQRKPSENAVLVSVEEAAQRLSIGRTQAYALVRRGELQSVKIGRTRRVVVASLQEYVTKLLQQA
jgi:excisionase family DNA binding protein